MRLSRFKQIAVLFVLMLVIVGCTPADEGGNQPEGPITLQWWGVFWGADVVEPLITEYEQLNPNVSIEYANKWPGGNKEVAEKLYQDELDRVLRDNNPTSIPDIFMVENTWAGNYERYTAPAPGNVIDANTVKTAFYPAVAKDFARGDVVRGLPIWMDSLAILYNKDLLAAEAVSTPPTDWIEFKELAQDLTTGSGSSMSQAGFAAGESANVSFGVELLNLLMIQNGVDITDSQGNPSFSASSDSEVALDFYQSFAASGGSWSDSMKNDAVAFLEGDLAMLVAPSWRYQDILHFNKLHDLGIDIGVAPMPQLVGQPQSQINWATYWGNMVALNRPNSEEAWKFLSWITSPEQLRKLRTEDEKAQEFFGFLYPRIDMQQDLQTNSYLRVYNAALSTAETWYMVDGLAVRAAFEELIETSGAASSISKAENDIQEIINRKGQL